jgi:ABC-type multidrug transport system permease subunit
VPVEELEKRDFFPEVSVEKSTPNKIDEGRDILGNTIQSTDSWVRGSVPPPGLCTQISMLFKRDFLDIKRNTKAVGARYIVTLFLSLLIGLIFLNVGSSDQTVGINSQSHFGALIMVLITSMFGTAQPPLAIFPEERPVFLREYSTNHYSVIAYFLSRLVNELVLTGLQVLELCLVTYYMIDFQCKFVMFFSVNFALGMASTALAVLVGCAFKDVKAANEMVPTLFVPQILFSGFFVSPSLIPIALRWVQYVCTLTYAVKIAIVEEFHDCNPDDLSRNDECNRIVEGAGADPDDAWLYWLALVCFFLAFRILALIVLQQKASF